MTKALLTYANEAKNEFVDKDQFNESDDDEYENPDKLLGRKERKARKQIMNR